LRLKSRLKNAGIAPGAGFSKVDPAVPRVGLCLIQSGDPPSYLLSAWKAGGGLYE